MKEAAPTPRHIRLAFVGDPDPRLKDLLPADLYQVVPIEDCQVAFLGSILWAHPRVEGTLEDLSREYGRKPFPLAVVLVDDHAGVYPRPKNLLLFRTSLHRSTRRTFEFPFPYVWEGLDQPFTESPELERPSVGFCGFVSKYRQKLVETLESDPRIDTGFMKRDGFWGGPLPIEVARAEFYDNLKAHPFNLCNRGTGNFSMRLYQTMSAGRIPVLVDTNMLLPLHKFIDWKEFCIFESSERKCANAIVRAFQKSRVPAMQRKAAEVYDQYIRGDGYFRAFFQHYAEKYFR